MRIVLEQPSANFVQRPLDVSASSLAQAPVLANGKAKF